MKELKKILKELPEEKPSKVAGNVVSRIIKREIERWKEKKISWFLLVLLSVLILFGSIKLLAAMEILDTEGFWTLVRSEPAFLDWQTFLEGFPVTEGLFVIVISLLIIVPIWVIWHKDKTIGR